MDDIADSRKHSDSSQPVGNQVGNSVAKLLLAAQVRGGIDSIEEYTNRLTDQGIENYLQIHHDLIKELEAKHD